MEGAGVDHRLTHEAGDHLIAATIADGEAHARCDGDVSAHDAMAAKEAKLLVEHVHRATLALRAAVLTAEEFGHDRTRRHATRERLSMVAVGGDDVVVGAEQRDDARGDGFLADVEVAEATDATDRVHLGAPLFEAALQEHAVQQLAMQRGIVVRLHGHLDVRFLLGRHLNYGGEC